MKRRELLEYVGLSAAALAVGEPMWPQAADGLAASGAAFNQVGYFPARQ
jgi:hypothetical protein